MVITGLLSGYYGFIKRLLGLIQIIRGWSGLLGLLGLLSGYQAVITGLSSGY